MRTLPLIIGLTQNISMAQCAPYPGLQTCVLGGVKRRVRSSTQSTVTLFLAICMSTNLGSIPHRLM